MDKFEIRKLVCEFLLYPGRYEYKIRVFLEKKKISYNDALLEEMLNELVRIAKVSEKGATDEG